MKVWIMRGIPGCGKDTFVKNELKRFDPVIICCDDYHTVNGIYDFKKEKAEEYHNYCLKHFALVLTYWKKDIVVNNTNIRMFEIAPYYRLAQAFGCEVEIVQFLCPPELGFKRNLHSVPLATIEMMARSIEPVPPWWNVNYIVSKE